jgi:hypothetical protein
MEAAVLDAALPGDDGSSPANGGWFPGPKGWMLLLEGLDERIDPWLEALAGALSAAGIDGTLTGAGTAGQPRWAQEIDTGWTVSGLVGFRPRPGFRLADGWVPGDAALHAAVALGMRWLTAHDARIMATADLRASFWAPPPLAARMLSTEARGRTGMASASGYHQQRREVRHAGLTAAAGLQLTTTIEAPSWRETVDELRSALRSIALEDVTIAMASYRTWSTLVGADLSGGAFGGRAYGFHPELWDEFTLDPCGIQVLTDRHLAKAADLSAWRTSRLDDGHVLVEARDLEPWFAPVRTQLDLPEPGLIGPARRDFGDMILTPAKAGSLGLDRKPDYHRPLEEQFPG